LENGIKIQQELFCPHEQAAIAIRWKIAETPPELRGPSISLAMRPLMSGRDYHSLHHENPAFNFGEERARDLVTWRPYQGIPAIVAFSNGEYQSDASWYRNFLYRAELERGLDAAEDLASPGVFRFDLGQQDAIWIASATGVPGELSFASVTPLDLYKQLATTEQQRRAQFASTLERAADQYIVTRYARQSEPSGRGSEQVPAGKSVIAGYPWFADWGRDTFIALRGLCIATKRFADAGNILSAWSHAVSEGMLPNRFPDSGDTPEYNSVDASLWYIIAAYEYLQATSKVRRKPHQVQRAQIIESILQIINGYIAGTRFGIRADDDGLLFAGQPGVQLTWMDAKVDDWVVTPRIGKPVEIQALWLNALAIAEQISTSDKRQAANAALSFSGLFELGRESFSQKFWNDPASCLYDVIDVDFQKGACDASLRPNQIFAVGGLPFALLGGERARKVVEVVERELLTPIGLRSLARNDPAYKPRYRGGVWERDGAYHQGTVWPWLMGPFIEAWLRVHEDNENNRGYAMRVFLQPLADYAERNGFGHICEVADADAPHQAGGCPFQAWSLGEALRVKKLLVNETMDQDSSLVLPVAGVM
jgi:predicted glycogen debranching enzyme